MHNSIQQSILLSLILVLAAHILFSPVALSVIFAIMLLLLYRHYKNKTVRISKVWTSGFNQSIQGNWYHHLWIYVPCYGHLASHMIMLVFMLLAS